VRCFVPPLLLLLVSASGAWPQERGGTPGAPAGDALERLKADPSESAAKQLGELFKRRSSNEKFWVVRALGARLSRFGEVSSLELLLKAAEDKDPTIRGTALRSMAAFTRIPEPELRRDWLARIDAAAVKGLKDPAPGVRGGAADLQRAIGLWKDPSSRKTPAPPEDASGLRWRVLRLRRALRWVWIICLPVPLALWAFLGLPVLDREREEGRRAAAAWRVLCRQRLAVALSVGAWICLVLLLASYGFGLLVRFVGSPLHDPQWHGWRDTFLAAFFLFAPGFFAASGLARRAGGSVAVEWVRSFLPAVAFTAAAFCVLLPLELVYRVFLRRVRSERPSGTPAEEPRLRLFPWLMENGALRSAYAAACVMGREGFGLIPALRRAWELGSANGGGSRMIPPLGLGVFDGRFGLLCAAPVFVLMCGLSASGLPVHWQRPWPFVVFGCALWSWVMLVGALFSALQVLEGTLAAGAYLLASGEPLPPSMEEMSEAFQGGPEPVSGPEEE